MGHPLDRLSWLVTARPYVTIAVVLVVTVALGAGAAFRAPPPSTAETLPEGGAVDRALDEIAAAFGDSGEVSVVTLIFRGDAFTPAGLSQMDGLIGEILSDPGVAALIAPGDSVVAPSSVIKAALGADGFGAVSQAEIDAVRGVPEIQGALAAMGGADVDGGPVSVAVIRLQDTGDERIAEAERSIGALAAGSGGPLRASAISTIIVEDEYVKATEEGMAPLVGMALLLIAALILLFMRTISDLLLTLAGLFISLIWIVGAEGWLGPNALGLTGPPNSLTTMVPIIVIGLTVDYAIQIVSHYRERRNAGDAVAVAVRTGLRNVSVPVALAAVTTIVSLLASLFSPIGIVGDFGIIAGMGVGMSFIVMMTLIPAGRAIIDRRREARGALGPPRPVAQALPGVERAAGMLGRSVTRRPTPYLIVVAALTVFLGFSATGIESEFSIRDILPRGGSILNDMDTLDSAVGGSTEMTSVLLKAEATEARTFLNMNDLRMAFEDEGRRPSAAAGPLLSSYESLAADWVSDSGEPGDKYDPELEALFRAAAEGVQFDPALTQEFLDKLEARDPLVGRVLVNNPDGPDSILIQFPAYSGFPDRTKVIQEDIERLWQGDDRNLTATSESIISITVTDSITERQTEAISATVAAALIVLAVFFWVTLRQPALSFIAVGPIVLVLIWVLGTMALLDIPYTLITSIITALSIGIGVDYTIHMIHRYREEYSHQRDPERAAVRTLRTTGSALLGSALTTALGLGVLVFSPLAASQQFGFTAAITIAYSLVVSIVVVPPAMTVWGAYQNMRLRSTMERMWDDLDEVIEGVYRSEDEERASS